MSYLPITITTIKLTTSISRSSPWPGCSPILPDILPPPGIYSCNFLGIAAVVLYWSVYMPVHRCWCVFPKRPLLLTFPRRANPLASRSPAAICVSPPPPISPALSLYARPLHSHCTLQLAPSPLLLLPLLLLHAAVVVGVVVVVVAPFLPPPPAAASPPHHPPTRLCAASACPVAQSTRGQQRA